MSDYKLHFSGQYFHKEGNDNPSREEKIFIGCAQCQTNFRIGGPPHEPSTRCESGSYNHCSCNRCF